MGCKGKDAAPLNRKTGVGTGGTVGHTVTLQGQVGKEARHRLYRRPGSDFTVPELTLCCFHLISTWVQRYPLAVRRSPQLGKHRDNGCVCKGLGAGRQRRAESKFNCRWITGKRVTTAASLNRSLTGLLPRSKGRAKMREDETATAAAPVFLHPPLPLRRPRRTAHPRPPAV